MARDRARRVTAGIGPPFPPALVRVHSRTLAQVSDVTPGVYSWHPARVRYAWLTIIVLSVLVPAVLIPYGYDYNAHTTSTVGGPVTLAFCIAIAAGFDLLLWLFFGVFLVARSARKATRELRDSPPGRT
jgi:hypothetical protein